MENFLILGHISLSDLAIQVNAKLAAGYKILYGYGTMNGHYVAMAQEIAE